MTEHDVHKLAVDLMESDFGAGAWDHVDLRHLRIPREQLAAKLLEKGWTADTAGDQTPGYHWNRHVDAGGRAIYESLRNGSNAEVEWEDLTSENREKFCRTFTHAFTAFTYSATS